MFSGNAAKGNPNDINQCKTRAVRKSDHTPPLALPKHMAGNFGEKKERKKNTGKIK